MLAHKELLAHKWMSNLRKPRGGARTLVDLEMLALFNGKAKLIRVECSTGRGDRIGRNTPETQAKNKPVIGMVAHQWKLRYAQRLAHLQNTTPTTS
jgi:hypothetical protein